MQDFTLEKVFLKIKSYTLSFMHFVHQNISQILNAVACSVTYAILRRQQLYVIYNFQWKNKQQFIRYLDYFLQLCFHFF